MKVLFAASEAAPYVKSGGLGDVIGSLPKALVSDECEVSCVIPLYDTIEEAVRERMTFLTAALVPVAWRNQYCGVFKLQENGVTWYFIDNEYYFKRGAIYGAYDDCERFAFFSRAVIAMIETLGLDIDIIHCHDWQTACVPVFLRKLYNGDSRYDRIKTVFTIHNIEYQGVYGKEVMNNVLGLPLELYENGIMQHDNDVNLMKSAILISDRVTTVSESYAEEIKTEQYGKGLQSILCMESQKLRGIINGIDDSNSPKTDTRIFKNYTDRSIKNKKENKNAIRELVNLPQNDDAPLIVMITRLVAHKGIDLICEQIDRLLSYDVQMIILGSGDWHYEQFLRDKAWQYPTKLAVNIGFNSDLAKKLYAAADIFLMPSKTEPCGIAQMLAMRYGAIPVVRETGGLKDTVEPYNKYKNTGLGFSFLQYDSNDMMNILENAISLWRDDRISWEKMMRRAMKADFSWTNSAGKYMELYREITG